MRFKVRQLDLQAGLASAKRVTTGHVLNPVLAGVLVETVEDGLLLTATDLELTTRVRVKAEVQEEGKLLLPTSRLMDLVARLSGELLLEETDTAVTVRQGKSHFSVKKMSIRDFPAVQDATGSMFTVPGAAWKRAAKRVIIAAASPQMRPQYAGVLVRAGAGFITLAGFDTYRIAVEKIALGSIEMADAADEIVIPLQAMREIESMLDAEDDLTITWPSREMYMGKFKASGFTVVTRLMDSRFPKFEKQIPAPIAAPLIINRDRLAATLGRAQLYTLKYTDESKKVVQNAVVALSAEGQELTIDAETDEGELHEVILLEKPTEPMRKKFTVTFLSAPLKFLGETVELHVTSGRSLPGIYREDDYFYMALPVNDILLDEPGGDLGA